MQTKVICTRKDEAVNLLTGKAYGGHNKPTLLIACEKNGWDKFIFCTFLQAKSKGLVPEKGSKGIRIATKVVKGEKSVVVKGKAATVGTYFSGQAVVFNVGQLVKA